MKLTIDPEANAAYMQLRERTGDLETVCVSDELNVDLLPDGTVYGIEFLNARQQLDERGGFTIVNRASGKTKTGVAPPAGSRYVPRGWFCLPYARADVCA